jgi:hypothetical protein
MVFSRRAIIELLLLLVLVIINEVGFYFLEANLLGPFPLLCCGDNSKIVRI